MQDQSLVFASEREAQREAARLRVLGIAVTLRRDGTGWRLGIDERERGHLAKLEALSAATPERVPAPAFAPNPGPSKPRLGKPALLLAGAAVIAWASASAAAPASAIEPGATINDGRVALSDDDGDAIYDRAVILERGQPTAIWRDTDHDGVFDHFLTFDAEDGSATELVDIDGDGFPDRVDQWGLAHPSSRPLTGS